MCATSRRLEGAVPTIILSVCAVLAVQAGLHAQEVSIGARLSTLGFGAEAGVKVLDRAGVRVGLNALSLSVDAEEEGNDYEFDIGLLTQSLLADFYFSRIGFRATAGVFANRNEVDMTAESQDGFELGDTVYPPDQVGTVAGGIDFDDINPYVGLGIDTSFGRDRGLGFVAELGALFQGSPKLTLSADGPIASDPGFQAELESERESIEDDMSAYSVYPVVALGISYRF